MVNTRGKEWVVYIAIFIILCMNFSSYALAAENQVPQGKTESSSVGKGYQEQRRLLLENLHKENMVNQERSVQSIMEKEYFSIGMVVLVISVIVYIIAFATLLVLMLRGNEEDENQAVV